MKSINPEKSLRNKYYKINPNYKTGFLPTLLENIKYKPWIYGSIIEQVTVDT